MVNITDKIEKIFEDPEMSKLAGGLAAITVGYFINAYAAKKGQKISLDLNKRKLIEKVKQNPEFINEVKEAYYYNEGDETLRETVKAIGITKLIRIADEEAKKLQDSKFKKGVIMKEGMRWQDILKYKATKRESAEFFEKYPQYDNEEDRKKIKKHALAWNKNHVKTVQSSFYDALEYYTDGEKMDLDSALKIIQEMYSSWKKDDDYDEMEEMERRRERSANRYFSGGGYNTGDY